MAGWMSTPPHGIPTTEPAFIEWQSKICDLMSHQWTLVNRAWFALSPIGWIELYRNVCYDVHIFHCIQNTQYVLNNRFHV